MSTLKYRGAELSDTRSAVIIIFDVYTCSTEKTKTKLKQNRM